MAETNHPQDLIRVKNPTNQDFTFYWDSIPHTINAGEEATYPRWMALHYAKKLIVSIINSKIQKVKIGERTVDSISTADPKIQQKLAPMILLYVYQRHIEQPKETKASIKSREFTLEEMQLSDKPRTVKNVIELPELEGSESELFGPVIEETPAGEPDQKEELPGDLLPEVETKGKKKATLQELQLEAKAMGLEISAHDTYEELEKKVLSSSGV